MPSNDFNGEVDRRGGNMPSGSDFTCMNPECRHCGERIPMHDFWPLARIDDILVSDRAKSGKFPDGYLDGIRALKKDGRELTCLPFPRQDDVMPCGIRVQLYCDNPAATVTQDIICKVNRDTNLSELAEGIGIARECGSCKPTLRTFREAFQQGIKCPHCGQRTESEIWYTTSG